MIERLKTYFQTNKAYTFLVLALFFVACLILVVGYTIFAFSPQKSAETTPPPTPIIQKQKPTLNPTQVQQLQTAADRNYAQHQKELDETYPWLNQLPLSGDNYFVYFDVAKKQFIGKLYPKTSLGSVDDQVVTLKNQVLEALKTQNIPYDQYQFSWVITPEP